jgi:hypothetical protein
MTLIRSRSKTDPGNPPSQDVAPQLVAGQGIVEVVHGHEGRSADARLQGRPEVEERLQIPDLVDPEHGHVGAVS